MHRLPQSKVVITCSKAALSRRATYRDGFTILEMVISAMLLAVGVVATLSVVTMAMKADANHQRSIVALSLAQGEMELIKNSSSWDAIDAFASSRISLDGDLSGFDKEVVISGDPKKVEVIISWNDRGLDQTVKLATLFSDYSFN